MEPFVTIRSKYRKIYRYSSKNYQSRTNNHNRFLRIYFIIALALDKKLQQDYTLAFNARTSLATAVSLPSVIAEE